MADQDLVQVLNRIADEIAEHLLWMREQDAKRTKIPPVEYKPSPLLAGQWPRRDGNIYGNVAKTRTELPPNTYPADNK